MTTIKTLTELQEYTKVRMQKCIHAFEEELSRTRAGRANPSILDNVHVNYYGTATPLKQVANILVANALLLEIKPFERRLIPEIEKAIHASDLGLNPATSGDVIRVPLPPLSEERRKELFKKVKGEGENAKVAIRNVRRDANQMLKDGLKDKSFTEDDEHKGMELMQKLTDNFIQQVDDLLTRKEKDLSEI